MKYKKTGETTWNHATLNTSGHTAPTGSTIDQDDSTGVFIYRDSDGNGSNDWNNAKLRWNYGTDSVGDSDKVTVKVFGIEMVYVPEGAFYVGDGSSQDRFHDGDSDSESFQVTSSQIEFGETDGKLWAMGDWDDPSGSLQTSFPTGYNAFYCMKYEIRQGQYADFLNTLTATQDGNRYYSTTSYRYTIGGSQGSRSASVPDRACNYLSWADGAAYADWAGLRPMTELEFEKACRGTIAPVANEYAWGTDTIVADASLTISGSEDGTETITTDVSAGAACYGSNTHSGGDGGRGPLRCGIFADGDSDRQEAGASYYGVMEMSGNLWERSVTVGNSTGRAFTGAHGDGSLDGGGDADASNWPGTDAEGAGFRGGGWDNSASGLCVSCRYGAAFTYANRDDDVGFRGVRSAP